MEKTVSTLVEGMTCGNCALTISKLLEKQGMKNVSANSASGEVSFTVVEEADIDKAFNAIDDLGYKVIRDQGGANGLAHSTGNSVQLETLLLIVSAILTLPLLLHMFIPWHFLHMPWVQFGFATPVYLVGCYLFLPSAYRSLKHRLPNMDVLIILGASAAYFYSLIGLLNYSSQAANYLFFETSAAIITLVMAGNWLEHKTVRSTTVAIDSLVKLQPQYATLVMTDSLGKETVLEVESKFVKKDDVTRVNTGYHIPVDGVIIFGDGHVDEHMITGESEPVHKSAGDSVVGGTLLVDGNLKVRATTVGNSSVLSNIIRMVKEAQGIKPPLQKLADKISAIFVPLVLAIAVITILVNYFFIHLSFPESMMRSIAVLVIACPCAMGLATPAAIAVGLGRAARNGILIKGGDTLESLKRIKNIVFDKTGTLTLGRLDVVSFESVIAETEFTRVVGSMANHSSHPVSRAVSNFWPGNSMHFTSIKEIKGKGMEATDEAGNNWKLGSVKWLMCLPEHDHLDLLLYKNDEFAGGIVINDNLRKDAAHTVSRLNSMGYNTILLSGDKEAKVKALAEQLHIKRYYSQHSPEEKNRKLDELMNEAPTAMVGDGINDAPALARATVGISLSDSTDIAIQSANLILSNNQLSTLPKAFRLGIYTEQTIRQNLFWAFIYNIIAIPVAAAGFLTPIWGAGIMAISDVILVINSLRLGFRNIDK
jgi:P-type Cu+ transporter